jgi:cbb3-type cytochrome oxidase subunit 3
MLRVVAALLGLAVYIWFIVDVLRTSSSNVRTLPKFVWLIIVILIPLLGGILWLLAGRPRGQGRRRRRGPVAPDDDPAFLRQLDDDAWVERMKRRRGESDGQAQGQAPA